MESWDAVAELLVSQAARTPIRVDRSTVVHPVHAGLRRTVGVPRGQVADYRLPLGPDTWLHVTEYADAYVVHREERTVRKPPRKSKADSGALLGFFVGLALGGSIGAALAGLVVGAVTQAGTKGTGRAPRLQTKENEPRRRPRPARKEET